MAPQQSTRKSMTDSHKAALAKGREEGRIVARYLEALSGNKPKRGRKRTLTSVKKQLEAVEARIASGEDKGTALVALYQQRITLRGELSFKEQVSQLDELEMAFVAVAKSYSLRHGISAEAWREACVPARVIRVAGIKK